MTSPVSPPAAHRIWRQPLLRFCGSLQLAMLLMAVLIIACITGTIVESRFDSTVARAYFYDAPWFFAWLTLLCVNLIAAVLVRYPWKPHQTGFIMTHAGIVVLLVGAVIGRIWGVEGNMTLFKDKASLDFLVVNEKILEVRGPGEQSEKKLVDLELRPPTEARPVKLQLQDFKIAVIAHTNALGKRTRVEKNPAGGLPAVRFILHSAMSPHPLEQWLLAGDPGREQFQFGPATIRLVRTSPALAAAPKTIPPSAPAAPAASGSAQSETRERFFAFARHPAMGMTRSLAGGPTGIKASYRFDGDEQGAPPSKGALALEAGDRRFEFVVDDLLDKSLPLSGTSWTITATKYLPDFRIQGNEPVSVSDTPNNPAVTFEIVGLVPVYSSAAKPHECDHKHDGDHGECKENHGACCPQPAASSRLSGHSAESETSLTIFFQADGSLRYSGIAKGKAAAEGPLRVGEEIPTGLADWKLVVKESIGHASLREEWAPLPPEAREVSQGTGILVEVSKGPNQVRQWIPSASPSTLTIGDERLQLSFGYRLHPLPFRVALEKFEVERNEGTQNPAGFKSAVRFEDPKSKITARREVWMNHPANFPDFPGAGLLGTSYKFSQASWNPDNLNQTTLQVLRDPGWSLKWIGSLVLCAGVFTMFYLKPYPQFSSNRQP